MVHLYAFVIVVRFQLIDISTKFRANSWQTPIMRPPSISPRVAA